jgi:hypothetical protein
MPSEAIVGRSPAWGTPPKPDLEIEVTTLPPIFLVGEQVDRQRLAKLLDGRGGISCAPESDLLNDLAGVARRNWPDLCRYGYPEQYWFRRVAGFFDSLQTEYAASRQLTRWAATADPGALALIDPGGAHAAAGRGRGRRPQLPRPPRRGPFPPIERRQAFIPTMGGTGGGFETLPPRAPRHSVLGSAYGYG